jgi:hypothetical protein
MMSLEQKKCIWKTENVQIPTFKSRENKKKGGITIRGYLDGGKKEDTAEEQDGIGSREIQQVRCFFSLRPSQNTIVDDRNLLLAPVCAHWN